jgi:hypothetical protein
MPERAQEKETGAEETHRRGKLAPRDRWMNVVIHSSREAERNPTAP